MLNYTSDIHIVPHNEYNPNSVHDLLVNDKVTTIFKKKDIYLHTVLGGIWYVRLLKGCWCFKSFQREHPLECQFY